MQPGIDNYQVLEIANVSPAPLALHPGTRICQFIFEKTVGQAKYSGRFSNQESP
jgi:dCTP deaminase